MEEIEALKQEIQQLRLAYAQAIYLGQFKAGFLARSAHELRSPLSRMMSLQQLILADLCENPAEEREFIQKAYEAAQQLVAMFEDILAIARLETGKATLTMVPLSLSALMQDVQYRLTLPAQNQNLRLTLPTIATDLKVLGDRHYLSQGLLALTELAIDTSKQRQLAITIHQGIEPNRIQITLQWETDQSITQEPIETLTTDLISLADAQTLPPLSPGLRLSIAQMTFAAMNSGLELMAEPAPTSELSRITLTCHLPLAL